MTPLVVVDGTNTGPLRGLTAKSHSRDDPAVLLQREALVRLCTIAVTPLVATEGTRHAARTGPQATTLPDAATPPGATATRTPCYERDQSYEGACGHAAPGKMTASAICYKLLVDQGRVERLVARALVLPVALAFLLLEKLVVALVVGRLFGSMLAHARSMPGRGRLQSNGRN